MQDRAEVAGAGADVEDARARAEEGQEVLDCVCVLGRGASVGFSRE